jgi:hypothetical protein
VIDKVDSLEQALADMDYPVFVGDDEVVDTEQSGG